MNTHSPWLSSHSRNAPEPAPHPTEKADGRTDRPQSTTSPDRQAVAAAPPPAQEQQAQ